MKIAEIRAKFPQYKDLSDRELVKGLHSKFYSDVDYPAFLRSIDFSERVDPTEGMGGFDKFGAGAGKAVSDLGLGARQIGAGIADAVAPRSQTMSGLVTGQPQSRSAEIQREVDDVKQRDAALMDTGAGMAGNITGNIATAVLPGLGAVGAGKAVGIPLLQAGGKALLSSPATLGGAAVQGGMGALQAGMQPVATGESRMGNTALGVVGGAIVPAAGMAFKGVKGAVEPLYEGGRQQILARAMRDAAGDNADDVMGRMAQARELIPGSQPTAGEVAQSGGIAAMQRAASAIDPEAYAARFVDQNKARVNALREVAGDPGEKAFFESSRTAAAKELYDKAYEKGVDIFRDPATGQFLPKAVVSGRKGEITNLTKRPAMEEAMERARTLAANEGVKIDDAAGSVKGLHYTKTALDDMIEQAAKRGQGNEQRILVGLRDRLLTTIDAMSPDYAQARVTFKEMSKPINRMEVGESILKGATSAQESVGGQPRIYGENLARALRDGDQTAARATGFSGSKIDDILEPQQLASLKAVNDDVARYTQSQNLGRGAGSDTVQKLSMANLLKQAGIPEGAMNFPVIGRATNWAYSAADDKMKQALAKALLNPQEASQIMGKGVPNANAQRLADVLRMTLTPGAIGTAPALLDARQ